jgi:hypothetical protein
VSRAFGAAITFGRPALFPASHVAWEHWTQFEPKQCQYFSVCCKCIMST